MLSSAYFAFLLVFATLAYLCLEQLPRRRFYFIVISFLSFLHATMLCFIAYSYVEGMPTYSSKALDYQFALGAVMVAASALLALLILIKSAWRPQNIVKARWNQRITGFFSCVVTASAGAYFVIAIGVMGA